MELNTKGVYKIINSITGDFYIGSTIRNFKKRWGEHKRTLQNNKGTKYLQNSWNKYGEAAFKFIVLEELTDATNILGREQFYIDNLKPKYNCSSKAIAARINKIAPEETKKRRRETMKLIPNNGQFKRGIEPKHKGNRQVRLCPYCQNQVKEYIDPTSGKFKRYQKTCGNEICQRYCREKARLQKENISIDKFVDITPKIITELRNLYNNNMNNLQIAEIYNLPIRMVERITSKRVWKNY